MFHTHFNLESRLLLGALLKEGYEPEEIAITLNKHISSVYRELNRNSTSGGSYHAGIAHRRARKRRRISKSKLHKIPANKKLSSYIESKLKRYWSPEQIRGRLEMESGERISTRTIYHFIYKHRPELACYLRCQKHKYRRRYGTKIREKRRELAKKRRIDTRPAFIEERLRLGDWEADTVVGTDRKQAIVTLVDRASGYLIAHKITRGTANLVSECIIKSLNKLPLSKRHTITFDNGTEFHGYEQIEKQTKAVSYFAFPYHSWERAINEYTNGLLRQFVPKKTSLELYTESDIKKAVTFINHRPKKRLGYFTPHEVFNSIRISS